MMMSNEYLAHLTECLGAYDEDEDNDINPGNYEDRILIMANLDTDPAAESLVPLYAPHGPGKPPRDPLCMLRALILMTVCREKSVTKWVEQTRNEPVLAVLAGFTPGDTPGVGTYYDFMRRIIDGPWRRPCEHVVRRGDLVRARHLRSLPAEKEAKKMAKKDDPDPYESESAKMVRELLEKTDDPRPDGFQRILDDLLLRLGVIPSVGAGLITDLGKLTVSGDGSILATAASPSGKRVCGCGKAGIRVCDHPRSYTSPTAEWCYDAAHDRFVFGDRYYHIITTQGGHDYPLIVIMPGGNKSDYTLSLKAFDRLLKAAEENGLTLNIRIFVGDGHHDSQAHYEYFSEKDVIPVIPLSGNTRKAFPKLSGHGDVSFDTDGTPLCPAGLPMRHHSFNKRRNTHVYACPAKRGTHRDGKHLYVTHADECPSGGGCEPDSSIGPVVYVKSADDPRLFPPIPRNSPKFRELSKQRNASERLNAVADNCKIEGAHRNADYGLIRLTLVNITHHAGVRHREAGKGRPPGARLAELLSRNRDGPPTEQPKAA